ncbi:lipase [Paenibacillus sp. J31TS4]|uniref:SGNH/GDSL hydrolase family protein n=1 Tax=Paenibacillus sp. J31TS4 TaxID=2807195 RepID=UPI001B0CA359|nr:SGNH/GDSL hydrolase family protein [Paenibacillus sp. J31TS4]GIP40351.1 lipase [Paenibacillus sp. J31TS4]
MAELREVAIHPELFHGAISLEPSANGYKPWRIPYRELPLFPPNGISGKAEVPAGVRLRFRTVSTRIELKVEPHGEQRLFDCVAGETFVTVVLPAGETTVLFEGLPADRSVKEIYLSQAWPVTVTGLSVEEGADLTPAADDRPRWVTYGSSITQCVEAESPSRTWPALVAARADLQLTCLGFSGSCHIEPMVARMIRDEPADFLSVCFGINVMGGSSLSPRTFGPAVIGFLRLLREKHADIPIAVLSPIYSPDREETPNKVGMDLRMIRQEVEAAVAALRECGDQQLYYMNGLEILSEADGERLHDRLHPDAAGYKLMAERLYERFERDIPGFPLFGRKPSE